MSIYDVDTTKYSYLEPIWEILANHPEGISLEELITLSGLDQIRMLHHIERLSVEYNHITRRKFTKQNIFNMVGRAMKGEKVAQEVNDDLVTSWIFDKVMLYARVKELDWTEDVMYPEEMQKMKEQWLAQRGM